MLKSEEYDTIVIKKLKKEIKKILTIEYKNIISYKNQDALVILEIVTNLDVRFSKNIFLMKK